MKSLADMRKVLKSIHGASNPRAPGPFVRGLPKDLRAEIARQDAERQSQIQERRRRKSRFIVALTPKRAENDEDATVRLLRHATTVGMVTGGSLSAIFVCAAFVVARPSFLLAAFACVSPGFIALGALAARLRVIKLRPDLFRCTLILTSSMALGSNLPLYAQTAATIETIAGNGSPENTGDVGPAKENGVGDPFGVEIGPDGDLYITEVRNHRVRRLDPDSGQIDTVAGNGRPGYSGDGGPANSARLNEPYEVRFDGDGKMYFVEMQNHVVRMVDLATRRISTIAGAGREGFAGDGGPATRALLSNPHSIALDGAGGLYIADIGNHRIRRVNLKTGFIETIAGSDEKKLPVEGQLAKDHPILGPRALFYADGQLWVALREGHSVWRLDLTSGRWRHVAATGRQGYAGDGGAAKDASVDGPKGIALGPSGEIVVVDTENNAIRLIEPKTQIIRTVAGLGPEEAGYSGDEGEATLARLNRPHGVCVGPDGAIYIGDTLNHRVRRVLARRVGK